MTAAAYIDLVEDPRRTPTPSHLRLPSILAHHPRQTKQNRSARAVASRRPEVADSGFRLERTPPLADIKDGSPVRVSGRCSSRGCDDAEEIGEAFMRVTPESKSVLDTLLSGGAVMDGGVHLGPFDHATQTLLKVVRDNHADLDSLHGEQQAKSLLRAYQDAAKLRADGADSETESERTNISASPSSGLRRQQPAVDSVISAIPSPPRWRLHGLTCCSIYGVAPFGKEFSFPFDGKATLLYGPNGSGKSSLLGAVAWVLTAKR